MFTFPLTPPSSPVFRTFKLKRVNIVGATKGPFSGQAQIQGWPGEWWEFDAALPPMTRRDAELWVSFLCALRGQSGTFLQGDPLGAQPQGCAATAGTPFTEGVTNAGSTTLTIRGWDINTRNIFLAGDYLQVKAPSSPIRLHKVLEDIGSDNEGNMNPDIYPAIRETLTDGQPITVLNPVGTFRLMAAANRQEWDIDYTRTYGLNFKAEEAI